MRFKTFVAVALSTAIFVSCTDTKYIDAEIENIKNQLAQLQQQCNSMNNSLETLDEAMSALNNRDYVTDVNPVQGPDGTVTGYVISFLTQPSITIWLPDNETNGQYAPVISVRLAEDGSYYWICDGEYITDDAGNRIPTGADGKTPKLKTDGDKLYVSYDGGDMWELLADIPVMQVDGYVFRNVDLSDASKVVITLSDGQKITLPAAYDSYISVSVDSPDVVHNPGDVITLTYTSLKNVSVIVDDSDVEASEVVSTDAKNGMIKIQTRSGVSLNKQRAFIIFTVEGAADADWRLLSFDSSMKARIADIK